MGMPSGESPAKAQQYYNYIQSHSQTQYVPKTWEVHWLDLAWLWGFLIVLVSAILFWVWYYRSTRQRIHPVDSFGGYTTELGRPAARFFWLLTVVLTGWAVALIAGHLIWGQKF